MYRVGLLETFGQLLEGLHMDLGMTREEPQATRLPVPALNLRWARVVSQDGAPSATRRPRAWLGLQGALLLAAGCTRTPTVSVGAM